MTRREVRPEDEPEVAAVVLVRVAQLRHRLTEAERRGQVELHVALADMRLLVGLAEISARLYARRVEEALA